MKPYAYKQTEHEIRCDVVLFVERSSELMYMARLSTESKVWSRREIESEKGEHKSYVLDPKPSDLTMVRMKLE